MCWVTSAHLWHDPQQRQLVTHRSLGDKTNSPATPGHLVTWVQFFLTLFTWKCCKRLCSSVAVIEKRLKNHFSWKGTCPVLSPMTVVSFPRTDSFTSHIVPYNHEHVGLNAPPAARRIIFFFCEFTNLLTGHMTVSRQAWPWNRFLFWEGVDPASSQQAPNKH